MPIEVWIYAKKSAHLQAPKCCKLRIPDIREKPADFFAVLQGANFSSCNIFSNLGSFAKICILEETKFFALIHTTYTIGVVYCFNFNTVTGEYNYQPSPFCLQSYIFKKKMSLEKMEANMEKRLT